MCRRLKADKDEEKGPGKDSDKYKGFDTYDEDDLPSNLYDFIGNPALESCAGGGGNCGGSFSVEPKYCIGFDAAINQLRVYCSHVALEVGDIVPLRIRVKNEANFDDWDGDTHYVPGRIKEGAQFTMPTNR